MTVFKGLLLFDMAEPDYHGWKDNGLGYRGMLDEWINKQHPEQFIRIEEFEDCTKETCKDPNVCTHNEVWIGDNKTGCSDSLGVWPYKRAMREARRFMRENRGGF